MHSTYWQIFRFGVIGLITNGIAYGVYVVLTAVGMNPFVAATVVYFVALVVGFVGHRTVTFAHEGRLGRTAVAYLVVYAIGYLIDLAVLAVGIDALGWSHVVAQAVAVVIVAVFLYVALRLFVFTPGTAVLPVPPADPGSALGRDGEHRTAER